MHGLVLNSQSVLRNDVTSYALARWVWDLFGVEFVFFVMYIVLGPGLTNVHVHLSLMSAAMQVFRLIPTNV